MEEIAARDRLSSEGGGNGDSGTDSAMEEGSLMTRADRRRSG
jgi:hypothetical protein